MLVYVFKGILIFVNTIETYCFSWQNAARIAKTGARPICNSLQTQYNVGHNACQVLGGWGEGGVVCAAGDNDDGF